MIMNAEQEQQLLEGSLARQFREGGLASNKTLRQWYAGMALQGILASDPEGAYATEIYQKVFEEWAKCAFRCADAMLAAEHLDAAGGK